jgi:hypothetical protein
MDTTKNESVVRAKKIIPDMSLIIAVYNRPLYVHH